MQVSLCVLGSANTDKYCPACCNISLQLKAAQVGFFARASRCVAASVGPGRERQVEASRSAKIAMKVTRNLLKYVSTALFSTMYQRIVIRNNTLPPACWRTACTPMFDEQRAVRAFNWTAWKSPSPACFARCFDVLLLRARRDDAILEMPCPF